MAVLAYAAAHLVLSREGVNRDWSIATKEFLGKNGKVEALRPVRLEWKDGKPHEVPGSAFEMPAELVLLAMGFVSPLQSLLEEFGVRGTSAATPGRRPRPRRLRHGAEGVRRGRHAPRTVARRVGDSRRPPVRARVDEFLMGFSELPR